MNKIFIGIDPGTTTGWFELRPTGETFYAQLRKNEVEPALESRLNLFYCYVTCESFVTTKETAKKGTETGAQDNIGVIKNICEKYDNCQLTLQPSAEKKRVPNKMLKDLGWWVPANQHAMDGARHLLTTLSFQDPILFDKIVGGD